MIERKNVGLCIVLSIITCGIYGLFWMARLNSDSLAAAGIISGTSGGMVVLLSIITCGIYAIYWNYKLGERLERVRAEHGEPTGSLSILYLRLSLFGLSIISCALAQSCMEKAGECYAGNKKTCV